MKKVLLILWMLALTGCGAATTTPEAAVEADQAATQPASTEAAEAEATEMEEATEEAGTESTSTEETEQAEAVVEATEEVAVSAEAADDGETQHRRQLGRLLFGIENISEGEAILADIAESEDTRYVAGLIDVLRFQPFVGRSNGVGNLTQAIGATLNRLTGQELSPDWFEWVEWAGQHPEIDSFDDYAAWKGMLYSLLIDPRFTRFVYADMKVAPDSRVEEIVWGGVQVDGIPALDNPTMVDPEEADYLEPDERVFGVSINGDTRAYPARFLDWHEMFNDIVGGEPVSLAY